MEWIKLQQDEALAFIKAVKDDKEPVLFDPSLCEVHKTPILFYDGYDLIRIVNRHMMPFLVMDFLSNGENHYYLNGSESAFHNLNAQRALSLDENNVINYLDLYISYVYERGNSLGFIHDPRDGFAAGLLSKDKGAYTIEAPLIYQDREIKARITVEQNGSIHVKDPLQVSFLTDLMPGEAIIYRHPDEGRLIEETKTLLSQTPTGQELIKTGDKHGAQIRILNSPNYQGYIKANLIYILMPQAENTAKYLQALVLAYALRDVDQNAHGFARVPEKEDRSRFIKSNYLKNLDMIEETCKIVDEYEEFIAPEVLQQLDNLDLKEVYEAIKQGIEGEALMDFYLDILERKGLMN